MKSRIICGCLCLVALGISMIMTINLINSEKYEPPVISGEEKNPIDNEGTKLPVKEEIELSASAIASFTTKFEKYIESLAYGEDKDFTRVDYYIDNLRRVAEHLSTTEIGDKTGADYLTLLADALTTAKNGYSSDLVFSNEVSALLKDIDSAVEKLDSKNKTYYPTLDTDANGSVTLSLLAIHEKNLASTDGSTFTVTVGGGVLLGDNLSTPESAKFANQFDKHSYLYPFYTLSSVLTNDDMTFIALEAPLTTETNSDSTDPAKGTPDFAKRLLGIDAVSLASNKVMQYGQNGLNETAKALKDNGISYSVQQGSQSVAASFGKVVYITFDLTDTELTDAQKDQNKDTIRNAVATERENGADIIIVLLHWNTRQRKADSLSADYVKDTVSEYEPHFDAYNKEIARAAIGNGTSGADLVVGYGSRVAQGIESYNNKMIVYETGDLTYSGSVDSDMKNTDVAFLFRQTFTKNGNGVKSLSYRIIPIVNTSEDNLYLPQMVFDEKADDIIDTLVYQSRYFGNPITNFNYISIKK